MKIVSYTHTPSSTPRLVESSSEEKKTQTSMVLDRPPIVFRQSTVSYPLTKKRNYTKPRKSLNLKNPDIRRLIDNFSGDKQRASRLSERQNLDDIPCAIAYLHQMIKYRKIDQIHYVFGRIDLNKVGNKHLFEFFLELDLAFPQYGERLLRQITFNYGLPCSHSYLTKLRAEIYSCQESSIVHEITDQFLAVICFITAVSKSKDTIGMLAIIALFLKATIPSFSSETLENELATLYAMNNTEAGADPITAVLSDLYDILNNKNFEKLQGKSGKLICLLLSYIIIRPENVEENSPFDTYTYKFFAEMIFENKLKVDFNLTILLAKNIILFADKGYNYFRYGKFRSDIDTPYNLFMDEVQWLIENKTLIKYVMDSPKPCELYYTNYQVRLSQARENVRSYLRLDTEGKSIVPRSELTRYQAILLDISVTIENQIGEMADRDPPMSLLFFGPPNVGKSELIQKSVRTFHYAVHPSITYKSFMYYERNGSEQYWSGYKHQKYIGLDDVGAVRAQFDKCLNELILLVNEVKFNPAMADVEDKGKVSVRPELIVVSSNSKDLRAGDKYNTKGAVLRRFPKVVTTGVIPRFDNGAGGLDIDKLEAAQNECPDTKIIWQTILVQLYKPTNVGEGYFYEEILKTTDISEYNAWLAMEAKVWLRRCHDRQKRKQQMDMPMCSHGTYDPMTCLYCLTEVEPDAIPSVEMDVEIDSDGDMFDTISGRKLEAHERPLVSDNIKTNWHSKRLAKAKAVKREDYYKESNSTTLFKGLIISSIPFAFLYTIAFILQLLLTGYVYAYNKLRFFRMWRSFNRYLNLLIIWKFDDYLDAFQSLKKFFRAINITNLIILMSAPKALYRGTKDFFYMAHCATLIKLKGDKFKAHIVNNSRYYTLLAAGATIFLTGTVAHKYYSTLNKEEEEEEIYESKGPKKTWANAERRVDLPKISPTHSITFDQISKLFLKAHVAIEHKFVDEDGRDASEIGCGINIGGNMIVTAAHVISKFKEVTITQFEKTYNLELNGNVWIDENRDIAIIFDQRIAPTKDLTKFFRTHDDYKGYTKIYTLVAKRIKILNAKYSPPKILHYLSLPHDGTKLGTHLIPAGRTGKFGGETTIAGDSGSIAISKDPRGFSVYGVHIARNLDVGFCAPITLIDINEAKLEFERRGGIVFDSPSPLETCLYSKTIIDPVPSHKSYFYNSPYRHGESVGQIRGLHVAGPNKSKVTPNLWKDEFEREYGKTDFAPISKASQKGAIVDGKWVDAFVLALNPRLKVNAEFKTCYLDKALEDLKASHKDIIISDRFDPHPLTLHEALNGIDGMDYVDGIKRTTSAGYPFVGDKIDYFMPHETLPDKISLKPEYIPVYMDMLKRIQNGETIQQIFKCNRKDEARSKEKLKNFKLRVFQSTNFIFSIIVRQYTLKLNAWLHRNRYVSEMAVGINATDPSEWKELVDYIKAYKKYGGGDYGKYDTTLDAKIKIYTLKFYLWIYQSMGANKGLRDIIVRLNQPIVYPLLLIKGELIQTSIGNVSGGTQTVQFNGTANSLYFRYSWYAKGNVKPFHENVRLQTYGDDAIFSTDSNFNQIDHARTMALHGVKYTKPDKTEVDEEYMPLVDIDFLQRSLQKDDEFKLYLAPIAHSSYIKSMCFRMKSSEISEEQHHSDILELFLANIARHSEEVFARGQTFAKMLSEKYLPGVKTNLDGSREEWLNIQENE